MENYNIKIIAKGICTENSQTPGIRLKCVMDGIPNNLQQIIEAEINELEKKAISIVGEASETKTTDNLRRKEEVFLTNFGKERLSKITTQNGEGKNLNSFCIFVNADEETLVVSDESGDNQIKLTKDSIRALREEIHNQTEQWIWP